MTHSAREREIVIVFVVRRFPIILSSFPLVIATSVVVFIATFTVLVILLFVFFAFIVFIIFINVSVVVIAIGHRYDLQFYKYSFGDS